MAGSLSYQDDISQTTRQQQDEITQLRQQLRQQQDENEQLHQQLRLASVETNKPKAENREQRSKIFIME
ncbi:hypothetical protein PtrSN002B_003913 [Pyrenophora tritici-repentis]|uniref:Med9 multi-domain protein n=1 Tax=Pyrenophora tritici-repentis TaxID=45151 RepID=A0A2W1E8C8_9PLEO|nr:hypothetical protein PtrV1_06372 [Pyrenophora tritici-repentis]KAF7451089.1 hypothetical protein A1F99_057050 [Pyrenophora tritici-repentis]KAF7573776.1 Med9 multi-domain protein [Pyrenophora tritici-repentis]KAG9380698.1 hypothetical protein A1F94_008018 [Pyrenophora tritici-repentis]KAI0574594.1 hypothetical protein Alg215_08497 [Pyrenophora tritici-repentis]